MKGWRLGVSKFGDLVAVRRCAVAQGADVGPPEEPLMRESDLWAVTAAAWEREKHRQGHPNDEGQGNWGNF